MGCGKQRGDTGYEARQGDRGQVLQGILNSASSELILIIRGSHWVVLSMEHE